MLANRLKGFKKEMKKRTDSPSPLGSFWGFISLLMNPVMLFFYVLELMVLYAPDVMVRPVYEIVPQSIEFAKNIEKVTGFGFRAYLFALILAASYVLSFPYYVALIFKGEKNALLTRLNEDPKRVKYGLGLGVLGVVCYPLVLTFLFGDSSGCSGCTTSSKFLLFLAYGILYPYTFTLLIAVGWICIHYLRRKGV